MTNPRTALREPCFTSPNLSPTFKQPSLAGGLQGFATPGVVFDDYVPNAPLLTTEQVSTLQLSATLFNLDESYET
jgi:hypothetical protein